MTVHFVDISALLSVNYALRMLHDFDWLMEI